MKPIQTLSVIILGGALMSAAAFGDAHAGGASGFAVVDSSGNLIRGSNATSAQHLSTGIYEVDFNSVVKKCVFTATTGLPGSNGTNDPAFVTVAGRGNNDEGVYITTFDVGGNSADFGFHLNVRC